MKIEDIAAIAHETNRIYCISVGDYSQPHWENAPEWQRTSAIRGVENILYNNATPEESHACWLSVKKADGWIYGPNKDVNKKEHPCMVPYNELPAEQKKKDHIFGAVVKALLGIKQCD